jgi:ribosomal protein S18 acetylase RimI-like enzyme
MVEEIKNIENNISICIAVPDDVIDIQEVFYRTWLATYPNEEVGITVDDIEDRYKDRLNENALSKRREQIANPSEGQTLLVAKDCKRVIGLCRVVKKSDRNQLQAIYVLPEYQGRGVGGKLWEDAKKLLDFTKDIYVEVATYNSNAISFYKKLGFVETGRRFTNEMTKMKSGSIIPEMEMVIKA